MDAIGESSWDLETRLAKEHPAGEFAVEGYCWIDQAPVKFAVDYLYAFDYGGRQFPNWRERMKCPICDLNGRQRAAIHVASEALQLGSSSRIFVTERLSPVHGALLERHPRTIGSEYFGADVAPGSCVNGVRHEDVTRLSFRSGSFDAVLSFDVFEHVPDYRAAFAECHRVLSGNGCLLFSVPFREDVEETRQRARHDADGTLVHLAPAQYHGDPVNPGSGVLCYHDFGWDLLSTLRGVGFADAAAIAYRSEPYGYLGGWQLLFAAWKDSSASWGKPAK